MKKILVIITVLGLSVLSGCSPAEKEWLTVDFKKDQSLRYQFITSRQITVDWGEMKSGSGLTKQKVDKSTETARITVAYKPVEVNPYGLSTIEAKCESVLTSRSKLKGRKSLNKDALNNLKDKTFTFTVGPTGRIEDYSQLEGLILQLGKKAFRTRGKKGRVKEPDMIGDFTATQWYLWDSISSIEKPIEGVSVGDSWKSQISVPTPMVLKESRDVIYRLDEIRQTKTGRVAVIKSSYSLAESVVNDWPLPYSGRFQMSGMFGFLSNYKVLNLNGEGEELFNIDKGMTERYIQKYVMELDASFPFGIGIKPQITIEQTLIMKFPKKE